ncbi:homocysteine S-methyltransferase family protein [Planctomicrobium sp. SH668]|uniref:homocysteine S-methyltransferase family protein n=1 Tax=Planctomicrobium sp. SH668 TaxID=3448126 RepID=UPI003F5CA1D8
MRVPIRERLQQSRPLILDGATGTELTRRGIDLNVPSWTAGVIVDQPETLWRVHRDYADAGADMITANTFRTHERNVRLLNRDVSGEELTRLAVQIARDASGEDRYVAGSVAPLGDCYSPQMVPKAEALEREHSVMVDCLADAGVDFILIETQLTICEALAAARAAASTGVPFGVSFVCNSAGQLLSGEPLLAAYDAILPLSPDLFMVNCVPAEDVLTLLAPVLNESVRISLGAYGNTGRLLTNGSWESTQGVFSAVYAEIAMHWIDVGLKLIGGCCGTTPDHISAIYEKIYRAR